VQPQAKGHGRRIETAAAFSRLSLTSSFCRLLPCTIWWHGLYIALLEHEKVLFEFLVSREPMLGNETIQGLFVDIRPSRMPPGS
jgi:hypothetical protein